LIGGQCYEVQLPDGTRQVFHKDHLKPYFSSEDKHQSGEPDEDHLPSSIARGHKRERLSSPPIAEDLPLKRRVRIVSSGHTFLAWKDEDGT
ncbi:hypothetical protein Pmar_PMAR002113, partial [Perkinsus marinus ATCC 50983]